MAQITTFLGTGSSQYISSHCTRVKGKASWEGMNTENKTSHEWEQITRLGFLTTRSLKDT